MQLKEQELYQPTDRRPIAARRWSIWQPIVAGIVKAGVSANSISVAGMVAGILAGLALALTSYQPDFARLAWLAAAFFIQLRLLANLLDGMVAIESGQASVVGELYNEVPDRVSDSAILIGAGLAIGGSPVLGCLAALAAMSTAYVRAIGKSVGAGQVFCGPMAKQHRMALLTVVATYLGIAPEDWHPDWFWLMSWQLVSLTLLLIIIGSLITAIRRLLRVVAHCRADHRHASQGCTDQHQGDHDAP
ncbi:MAG: CDP-alcohol phosphatidyltransferase family protein [Pirellulaceae bacterium]|nr:CDP-alcohol phosphatidyltransferase family protein [Pirellulaceae bacterium]